MLDAIFFHEKGKLALGAAGETASWMSPYIFVSLDAAERVLGLNRLVSYHLLKLPEGANRSEAVTAIEEQVSGVDALTHDHRLRQIADRVLWLEDGQLGGGDGRLVATKSPK